MFDNSRYPQFYNSRSQATATALGLAACGGRAVYMSTVGHANAVQALWASAVQRNSGVWVSYLGIGARMTLSDGPRKRFTASIPNSSYVHGVFAADAPNIIVVTDPRGARLDDYHVAEKRQRKALLQEHKEQFYRDFIAALASMPSVEVPVLPEWGEPLWTALSRNGHVWTCSGTAPINVFWDYGDCLLAIEINPDADWNSFIVQLANSLQTQ